MLPEQKLTEWDIDLFKIALILEEGHSESFYCETCDNRSLYKDDAGFYYLGKEIKGDIHLFQVNLEDLMAD